MSHDVEKLLSLSISKHTKVKAPIFNIEIETMAQNVDGKNIRADFQKKTATITSNIFLKK